MIRRMRNRAPPLLGAWRETGPGEYEAKFEHYATVRIGS